MVGKRIFGKLIAAGVAFAALSSCTLRNEMVAHYIYDEIGFKMISTSDKDGKTIEKYNMNRSTIYFYFDETFLMTLHDGTTRKEYGGTYYFSAGKGSVTNGLLYFEDGPTIDAYRSGYILSFPIDGEYFDVTEETNLEFQLWWYERD